MLWPTNSLGDGPSVDRAYGSEARPIRFETNRAGNLCMVTVGEAEPRRFENETSKIKGKRARSSGDKILPNLVSPFGQILRDKGKWGRCPAGCQPLRFYLRHRTRVQEAVLTGTAGDHRGFRHRQAPPSSAANLEPSHNQLGAHSVLYLDQTSTFYLFPIPRLSSSSSLRDPASLMLR